MKTINKIKQEFLVWSIILGVFATTTVFAINFDSIRKSPLFNKKGAMEGHFLKANDAELHQPGNSVVLAQ